MWKTKYILSCGFVFRIWANCLLRVLFLFFFNRKAVNEGGWQEWWWNRICVSVPVVMESERKDWLVFVFWWSGVSVDTPRWLKSMQKEEAKKVATSSLFPWYPRWLKAASQQEVTLGHPGWKHAHCYICNISCFGKLLSLCKYVLGHRKSKP